MNKKNIKDYLFPLPYFMNYILPYTKDTTFRSFLDTNRNKNYVNNNKNKNIFCLGCSMTYGAGLKDTNNAWPTILEKKIRSEYNFYNLGIPASGIMPCINLYELLKDNTSPSYIIFQLPEIWRFPISDSIINDEIDNHFTSKCAFSYTEYRHLIDKHHHWLFYRNKIENKRLISKNDFFYKYMPTIIKSYSNMLNLFIEEQLLSNNKLLFLVIEYPNAVICHNNSITNFMVKHGWEEIKSFLNEKNMPFASIDYDSEMVGDLVIPNDGHPSEIGHEYIAQKVFDHIQLMENGDINFISEKGSGIKKFLKI